MKKLNCVYMRVLRRIADDCKFGHCAYSDAEVRRLLCQPSLDCLLMRRRMLYLGRILRVRHKSLLAALSLSLVNKRLPWVKLICNDFQMMHSSMQEVRDKLPSPSDDSFAWADFIVEEPLAWHDLVVKVYFSNSCLDRNAMPCDDMTFVNIFACHVCAHKPSFPTNKAYLQHMRKVHDFHDPITEYIDGSGICPVCHTHFRTRLRCLAHVCDTRRTKCRDAILVSKISKVPPAELANLRSIDQSLRNKARRDGHSHPIAVGSACKASGKRIGHVSM